MMNDVDLIDVKEGEGGERYHPEESFGVGRASVGESFTSCKHVIGQQDKERLRYCSPNVNERYGMDSQYCDLVIDSPTTYLKPKTSC